MANESSTFLVLSQLASDKELQGKFSEDPSAAMDEHNMPAEHQEAIKNGQKFSFSFCPETYKNDSPDNAFLFKFL